VLRTPQSLFIDIFGFRGFLLSHLSAALPVPHNSGKRRVSTLGAKGSASSSNSVGFLYTGVNGANVAAPGRKPSALNVSADLISERASCISRQPWCEDHTPVGFFYTVAHIQPNGR
jgi:hypothetical protein